MLVRPQGILDPHGIKISSHLTWRNQSVVTLRDAPKRYLSVGAPRSGGSVG